jgi:hypothetical protein
MRQPRQAFATGAGFVLPLSEQKKKTAGRRTSLPFPLLTERLFTKSGFVRPRANLSET